MTAFGKQLYLVLTAVVDVVSPVLLIVALAGAGCLLYSGVRERKKNKLFAVGAVALLVLFCCFFGMIRVSSRYFLILLPVAILLAGYLLNVLWRRNRIVALILGIGIIAFQTSKDFRIDPGIRKHIAYFQQISAENAGCRAAVLILDAKEINRFGHYIALPCYTPTNWDVRTCDAGLPFRFWQRYIFVNDVVYLGLLPTGKQAFKVSDFPCGNVCRVTLDYQEFKGRHHKKYIQFFRFDSADQNVAVPASATSQLPLLPDDRGRKTASEKDHIAPEWSVFSNAAEYWRAGETRYRCERFPEHWAISMEGPRRCALRSEKLDLGTSFNCYLEYTGRAVKPLEIRLIIEGDGVYRDMVVAFLPMDDRSRKRTVKLSFYPEMNPEKKNTMMLINMPDGGELVISRLAFD